MKEQPNAENQALINIRNLKYTWLVDNLREYVKNTQLSLIIAKSLFNHQ